jgi:hypothetical protein
MPETIPAEQKANQPILNDQYKHSGLSEQKSLELFEALRTLMKDKEPFVPGIDNKVKETGGQFLVFSYNRRVIKKAEQRQKVFGREPSFKRRVAMKL